jgi:hypothetical protein
MLALTTPDPALGFPDGTKLNPKVFLRNGSHKSFAATATFHWHTAAGQSTADPIKVVMKPDQTIMIDVADLQVQNKIPPDAYWASVTVSAPVQPDELVAVAASYDDTLRYGAQTPFSDQLAFHWEGGRWEVDDTHNSLMMIGNGGDKNAKAELTILYDGGKSNYVVEKGLAPGEQMYVNMAKIIREQIADKNGKTLPVGLTTGTYHLRDLSDLAVGDLYEGKVVTDKRFGHASYGCMICCGYPDGGFMVFDPLDVIYQGSSPQSIHGINACWQEEEDITGSYGTWWTGNTSIATASMNTMNGMGAGGTNGNATGPINVGDGTHRESCPVRYLQPQEASRSLPQSLWTRISGISEE